MFFGLTNSPATFQTMMNDILRDLISEGEVLVYLDDILVFSSDSEKHREVVQKVLSCLRANGLYLWASKCEFERREIEYLGLIIAHNEVRMDPVKVDGVAKWPNPRNVKDLQSFLGFCNFYRRFICDFSHIAGPLFDLTKKDKPWAWSEPEETAFQTLKDAVTSGPVLMLPDSTRPYRVEADSSDFALGAVLSQESPKDGKWHPVAFMSKSLGSVERNYVIHDKEMLAIIEALKEWRHYLEGSELPFEIWTDHKNLEYFRTARKLNRRQARWSLLLAQFDFELHHRPGRTMGRPDTLSRRADHGVSGDENKDVVLLSPEMFAIKALAAVDLTGDEGGMLREIREALQTRPEAEEEVVKAARELLGQARPRTSVAAEWSTSADLLLYHGKVVVPKNQDLRRRIVEQHHDSRVSGHPGRWKTLELVSRTYWWPNMSRFVGQYTSTCDLCSRSKALRSRPLGLLNPNEVPEEKWSTVTVDFITELPESHGYDAIMVVVDRLTKRAHVLPTHTTISAEGTARMFLNHIWKLHGLPRKVISDRGPQFVAEFTRELYRLLGIQSTPSMAYHPQTNGQTERVNQEVEQYLRLFCSYGQNNWDELLPLAEFSYNNQVHSLTRVSPFELDSGVNPRMGFEPPQVTSGTAGVTEFRDAMAKGLDEARAALSLAQDEYKKWYDRGRDAPPEFKVGDRVWLDASDIGSARPSAKLDFRRIGPFPVTRIVGKGAYELGLTPRYRSLHPVFPVVKLKLAEPDPFPGRQPPPPPEPVRFGSHEEFEVEKILEAKFRWNSLWYYVRWRGYNSTHDEWVWARDMTNAPEVVAEFY